MTSVRHTRAALTGFALLLLCATAALTAEPAPGPSEAAVTSTPETAARPEPASTQAEGKTPDQPAFERFITPTIDTDLNLGLSDGS